MASTTLDLPDPFGPTTTVTPGSNSSVVGSAKDLNPFSVRAFRSMGSPDYGSGVGRSGTAHRLPVDSRLAARADVARPIPHADLGDGAPAAPAGLAVAAVDLQLVLEAAGLAV